MGHGALLPNGKPAGKNNPRCHGHIEQVGGRAEFGFAAENTAEISNVPQFPYWCVGTVSRLSRVKLRMLFSAVLGGGRTASTWSCVSSCRLRQNPTQRLVLKHTFKLSVLCLSLFPPLDLQTGEECALRSCLTKELVAVSRFPSFQITTSHRRAPDLGALLHLPTLYSLPRPCKSCGCSERKSRKV